MGGSPVALSCVCIFPCFLFVDSKGLEHFKFRSHSFPLFPVNHANTSSHPFIRNREQLLHVGYLEVVYPPHDIASKPHCS